MNILIRNWFSVFTIVAADCASKRGDISASNKRSKLKFTITLLQIIFISGIISLFIFLQLPVSAAPNIYYGSGVSSNPQLQMLGLAQNIPNFIENKSLSISFEYAKFSEDKSRDVNNNYGDYSGRNIYASDNFNRTNLNSISLSYKNFIFGFNREYDIDYEFTENIFDASQNKIKENQRKSDGYINSLALYYILNLNKDKSLKMFSGLTYSFFKNEINIFENFISPAFGDYSLAAEFDGKAPGINISLDYSPAKKFRFIAFYKSPVKFKGDYLISNNAGLVNTLNNKTIKYPQELSVISIFTLSSEHFTKLFTDITYSNWKKLDDREGFSLPAANTTLKNTLRASIGLQYSFTQKLKCGTSVFYEPAYFDTRYRKIGVNLGSVLSISDKIDLTLTLNYTKNMFKENYPFTLQASGARLNRADQDYSENTSIKINAGINYKL